MCIIMLFAGGVGGHTGGGMPTMPGGCMKFAICGMPPSVPMAAGSGAAIPGPIGRGMPKCAASMPHGPTAAAGAVGPPSVAGGA